MWVNVWIDKVVVYDFKFWECCADIGAVEEFCVTVEVALMAHVGTVAFGVLPPVVYAEEGFVAVFGDALAGFLHELNELDCFKRLHHLLRATSRQWLRR